MSNTNTNNNDHNNMIVMIFFSGQSMPSTAFVIVEK